MRMRNSVVVSRREGRWLSDDSNEKEGKNDNKLLFFKIQSTNYNILKEAKL